MLVPLNIRNSIYEYLLNGGVMTAIEDVTPKCIHPAIKVRNLYVMNVMKKTAQKLIFTYIAISEYLSVHLYL